MFKPIRGKILLYCLVIFIFFLLTNQAIALDTNVQIITPTGNEARIQDQDDYANVRYSDIWDMSNYEDAPLLTEKISNVYMKDGKWYGTIDTNSARIWLQWPGFVGSYLNGREGDINKINTNEFDFLLIKLFVTITGKVKFNWVWNRNLSQYGATGYYGPENNKWGTYYASLYDYPDWKNSVAGFYIHLVDMKGVKIGIDWVRLLKCKALPPANLSWNYSGFSRKYKIYIDKTRNFNGSFFNNYQCQPGLNEYNLLENSYWSYKLHEYPRSNYYIYLSYSENTNYSPGPIKFNNSPTIKVLDPDISGGTDWAKKTLGNPWDFNRLSDATYKNISGKKISSGVFSGVNTTRDPVMLMRTNGKRINTNIYSFLTFKYKYSGAFDLHRGTMARFIWKPVGQGLQTSDDIVTYANFWRTYTIDLKKIQLNGGRYGWRGSVSALRFDPNEDTGHRRFYLDYIKLAAEDKLSDYFDIKYQCRDLDNSKLNLKLYYDVDKTSGNGNEHLIVSKTILNGIGRHRWRPSRSLRRRVWIYAKVSDGINAIGNYSSGMLRVHL